MDRKLHRCQKLQCLNRLLCQSNNQNKDLHLSTQPRFHLSQFSRIHKILPHNSQSDPQLPIDHHPCTLINSYLNQSQFNLHLCPLCPRCITQIRDHSNLHQWDSLKSLPPCQWIWEINSHNPNNSRQTHLQWLHPRELQVQSQWLLACHLLQEVNQYQFLQSPLLILSYFLSLLETCSKCSSKWNKAKKLREKPNLNLALWWTALTLVNSLHWHCQRSKPSQNVFSQTTTLVQLPRSETLLKSAGVMLKTSPMLWKYSLHSGKSINAEL